MLAPPSTPFKAFAVCLALICAGVPATADAAKAKSKAKAKPAAVEAPIEAPATVSRMAYWVTRSGDNQAMPFAIIDKAAAKVFVYDADGKMLGGTAALIGLTPGDDAVGYPARGPHHARRPLPGRLRAGRRRPRGAVGRLRHRDLSAPGGDHEPR